MKKNLPANYYDFFLEIPPTDYLNDIEIQDEYENLTNEQARGLSEEQVSQIAIDSLSEVSRLKQHSKTPPTKPSLPQQ